MEPPELIQSNLVEKFSLGLSSIYLHGGLLSLSRWNLLHRKVFRHVRHLDHVVFLGNRHGYDALIPHAVHSCGYEWFGSETLCLDFLHHLPQMFKSGQGVFLCAVQVDQLKVPLLSICSRFAPQIPEQLWMTKIDRLCLSLASSSLQVTPSLSSPNTLRSQTRQSNEGWS